MTDGSFDDPSGDGINSTNTDLTVGGAGSSGVTFASTTAIGGDGLHAINSDDTERTVSITDNTWGLVNSIGDRGIFADVRRGALNLTIDGNAIDRTVGSGISVDFQDGSSGEVLINDNNIGQAVAPDPSDFVDGLSFGVNGGGTGNCSPSCPTGTLNLSMTNNMIRIESSGGAATFLAVSDESVANLTVTGNTFDNDGSLGAADFGVVLGDHPDSTICLDLRENRAIGSEGAFNLGNFGGTFNLYHATEAGAVAAADIAAANTAGTGGFPIDIVFTNTACPLPTVP